MIRRWRRDFWMNLAWLLPRKLVYWCVVRAAVKAEPNLNPSGVTAIEMMREMS